MMQPLARILLLLVFAAPSFADAAVGATPYPARPLRILVPFPAGGAGDTIARSLGEALSAGFGQPVIVDNRAGAGGRVATELLAKAEPDGHTLLLGTVGAIAISPALYSRLPYDTLRDLLPVSRSGEVISVMVVNSGSGTQSVRDFIEWSRKRTAPVRFGSSGTGQPDHIAGEFFQRLAGVTMTHVPYKGGGPALVDLIAGDLQIMFSTYVVAAPHIRSGRLRALAVTARQRQPLLPDLPAVAETLPGFGFTNWNGIFVPGKTGAPIAEHLHAAVNKALQAPEVRKRLQNSGIEPLGSASRQEFARLIGDDMAMWSRLVKEANIQVE